MYNTIMNNDFYSIKEFATKMKVSTQTIYRAIKAGRISAIRVGSSSRAAFRIAHSEIERMGLIDLQKLIQQIVEIQIKEREK